MASKMASKNTKAGRESITCLITVLPPAVRTYADFIELIAINCFPEQILPIRKMTDGATIETDGDGKFVIAETPDTIKCVECKTINTERFGPKLNITIMVPIPRESDPFYGYMMENLIDPLTSAAEDSQDRQLATLYWDDESTGKERYVKLSLVKRTKKIPSQDRFRRV
jgi:hypothetical protein